MINLSGHKKFPKIEFELKNKLLKYRNPKEIREIIRKKSITKNILKTWAEKIQPTDKYKWETKAEDNWLE